MPEKITLKEKCIAWHWTRNEKQDLARIARQEPTMGITQHTDIAYIDDGHSGHLLDVYYPNGAKKPLPVIVNIHGGGFTYGYKELNKNYNLFLASYGFTVVSLNYRLAPEVRFPAQIQDLSAALHWLAAYGREYPCDMETIFLTGDSAGAMLAMYSTLTQRSIRLQQLYGVQSSGLPIRALGLVSGGFVLDRGLGKILLAAPVFGKGYKQEPSFQHINLDSLPDLEELPPCYLVTSKQDFVCKHSQTFAQALQRKGVPCRLQVWPKQKEKPLTHIFSVTYPLWEESRVTTGEMIEFFLQHQKQPVAR